MRALIVEDDPDVSGLLRAALKRDGHVVEHAATGEDALWMATEFDFDVVVLDWELPTMDGVSVCRSLRERGRWVPIIMLTAHREIDERVTGLRAGADDYLTKPFAIAELTARIEAVARRAPVERPTTLRVGDLELDPGARTVTRAGTPIALRPKELALLELLMRRAGQVVSRAEILDHVWDLNFDGMSNVVDVHIKSLRAKVDKPFGVQTIETVWRVGYRLVEATAVVTAG